MTATRGATAFGLIVLMLASGCTTPPSGDPASPPPGLAVPPQAPLPETAPPAPVTEDSCGVEGLVMDDDLNPLPGAEVRIPNSAPRRTAQDGRFSFGYLEPDVHQVTVSGEGWESQTRDVMCRAGERVTDVYFMLERPPWWGEPFVTQHVFRGRFGCAVADTDPCSEWPLFDHYGLPDPTPLDPEAKVLFEFQMEPGRITGAVYEMKWSHSSGPTGGFEELRLEDPLYTRSDQAAFGTEVAISLCPTTKGDFFVPGVSVYGVYGGSVLCARFEAVNRTQHLDTISPPPTSPTGGTGHLRDFYVSGRTPDWSEDPANVDRHVRVAVGQSFEVFMAFFYHGAPIPDDYAYFER